MTDEQNASLDHKKLLWEFTTDGIEEMVNYMLALPGVRDVKMEDGTTSFVMALSRQDSRLVEIILTSEIPSEIDSVELAQRALRELNKQLNKQSDENFRLLKLKAALANGLKWHLIEEEEISKL